MSVSSAQGAGTMVNRNHYQVPGTLTNATGGIVSPPVTQSMSTINTTASSLPTLPHQQLPGESTDLTLSNQPLSLQHQQQQQQQLHQQQSTPQQQQQQHMQQQQQQQAIAATTASATSSAFLEKLSGHLSSFWTEQLSEMRNLGTTAPQTEQDFKNHNDLPLARIKRIMKSDEDVRMISAEAPVLFAKACEMFILELTLRSWSYSENNKRRTLQKEDTREAIQRTDIFDFLVDVIH